MVSEPAVNQNIKQVEQKPYRFSVEDYERLLELGFLSPDDRVELINGEIVKMAPMGSAHRYAIINLSRKLWQAYGDLAAVMVQCSLKLPPGSEPEPDLALLKLPEDAYKEKAPTPEDVFLLIVVSDSTLTTDRTTKLSMYARASIPEVWILNLNENQLEIYRDPKGKLYGTKLTLLEGESAAPQAFPDSEISWSL